MDLLDSTKENRMNKAQYLKIHEALRYIHHEDRKHLNCIRLDPAELEKDWNSKTWNLVIKYCKEFRAAGIPFVTQARIIDITNNKVKGRADLITLADYNAYEFMMSETEERLNLKDYSPFKITKVIV